MLYYCGLRVSELINIKLVDLKFNNTNAMYNHQARGCNVENSLSFFSECSEMAETDRTSILKGEKSDYLFVKFYKNKVKMIFHLFQDTLLLKLLKNMFPSI